MLFASDFGKLVPWWFYAIFAIIGIIVATVLIFAGIAVLVAVVRILGSLLSGRTRKPFHDQDSDGAQ